MAFGSVLLTVLVIAWTYFLWSRRRFYVCAWKMTGPWGLPLIGILYRVFRTEDILPTVPVLAKEYNRKTFFTWFGPYPAIFTIDPKVAEMVLQSPDCLNKTSAYQAIDHAAGNGILTSPVNKWTKHRKILNPCVGHKVVLGLVESLNNYGREFCDRIDKHVGCGQVDIRKEAIRIGLRSSFNLSLETDLSDEECSKFAQSFDSLIDLTIYRTVRRWLTNPTIYSWMPSFKTYLKFQQFVEGSISSVIKSRHQSFTESKSVKEAEPNVKNSQNFINQMIQGIHRNEFTTQDAIAEGMVMVLAGFETSAGVLYSTLMFLAMHPHFQEQAHDEIITLFCDQESDLTAETLKQLVYLEMCINETMRLAPSIPIIGRECGKDFRISEDIVVPAGGEIYIDIFNIQRDEDTWGPTAKQFNPDHFLPSNLEAKQKSAYLPFSKGKRNCIGWYYAGIFLKIVLAHALRKYRFSTTFRFEDLRYDENIFLKYVKTPLLEVHRR